MTDDELKTYYSDLLILQYKSKAKAVATIQALVEPIIMGQLPLAVQNAYDLETAVGVQLDVLGEYVGVTRTGSTFSGIVTLGDDDFRVLVKIAIIRNNSGSSLNDIQNLLNTFFPGTLFVYDYKNMHMSYAMESSVASTQLAELLYTELVLPKPMGVMMGSLIFAPDITHFFGFRTFDTDAFNAVGFNFYDNYVSNTPWLSYADAINF